MKNKYGMIDSIGNIKIAPISISSFSFVDTLAIVYFPPIILPNLLNQNINKRHNVLFLPEGTRSAIINDKGIIILPPTNKYVILELYKKGYAKVRIEDKDSIINLEGKILNNDSIEYINAMNTINYNRYEWDSILSQVNQFKCNAEKLSLRNNDVNKTVRVVYNPITNLYGYINKKAQLITPFQFNEANAFYDKYAIIVKDSINSMKRINREYGLIDTLGKYNYLPQYNLIKVCEGLAIFAKYDKNLKKAIWGLIDFSGKEVFNTDFEIISYSEGMVLYRDKTKFGFINMNGEIITKAIYYKAKPFKNGIAQVILTNGKICYINKQGKYIWK